MPRRPHRSLHTVEAIGETADEVGGGVRGLVKFGLDVAVLGDVHVKHAAPLFDVPIEDAAADLAERGGADAVIVSGSRSPDPPSLERVVSVKAVVQAPVLVGSGVSLSNVTDFYEHADGVLIGETDFKVDGVWGGRSDGRAYAEAARLCRGG